LGARGRGLRGLGGHMALKRTGGRVGDGAPEPLYPLSPIPRNPVHVCLQKGGGIEGVGVRGSGLGVRCEQG